MLRQYDGIIKNIFGEHITEAISTCQLSVQKPHLPTGGGLTPTASAMSLM